MSDITQLRSRWRRWLGQKCRTDRHGWADLVGHPWIGWAARVLGDDMPRIRIFEIDRIDIYALYREAIDRATFDDLLKLDDIYAYERWIR